MPLHHPISKLAAYRRNQSLTNCVPGSTQASPKESYTCIIRRITPLLRWFTSTQGTLEMKTTRARRSCNGGMPGEYIKLRENFAMRENFFFTAAQTNTYTNHLHLGLRLMQYGLSVTRRWHHQICIIGLIIRPSLSIIVTIIIFCGGKQTNCSGVATLRVRGGGSGWRRVVKLTTLSQNLDKIWRHEPGSTIVSMYSPCTTNVWTRF